MNELICKFALLDHCMVTFVKPKLLGTRKEFSNRFVNPITNGQCSDSTPYDVKIMKRRAHILHETLAGCVQVCQCVLLSCVMCVKAPMFGLCRDRRYINIYILWKVVIVYLIFLEGLC